VSRQTAVALAAVIGLLAGLGTLAGVVLALRDEGGNGDDPPPAAVDTSPVETGDTGTVVTEPSPDQLPVEVPVEGFPNAVAVGRGGVWVVRDGRRVIRIDPQAAEIVARIGAGDELGSERPCGIAVGAGAVWVTTLSGRLARINPETNRLAQLLEVEDAACVAAGPRAVWVTAPNRGLVMRIDPETNEVVAEIPLEGFPLGVAIGFGSIWVAAPDPPEGGEGAVSRIDPRSNEVVRTILVDNLPEFVAAGEGAVWATSNNGSLTEIDPRTNQVVATVRVTDGGRTSVAVGGGAVWATELAGPGQEAPVVRINPETAEVEGAALEAVRSPLGLAWGAGALWITGYEDGIVSRFQPAP
jgi:streptogramin lyase